MTDAGPSFEDVRIGVRLKISALWVAMLFLFAYGDIFGFFRPGQIEEVAGGRISGIAITQAFLFAVSVYIAIASAMVFLTLVLKPTLARWTNVVLPVLYAVSIVASVIGEEWAYFWLLSIAEVVVLLGIVWYAWMWPRKEADR
jgi:general stress protein CsbA